MIVAIRGRRLLLFALVAAAVSYLLLRGLPPLATVVSSLVQERRVPIYKVARDDAKVSISLDATWGVELTDEILDILDEHNVKTTFFLAGYWVEKHPDYVKKIVARGHEVGNHSYAHPHMNQLSKAQIKEDLSRNHEMLKALTGVDAFLFRPPFGEYSNKVIEGAEELGYLTIQWSIDSLDWKEVSADFMVQRVMERVGPGDIILFHNAGKHTPAALRALLPRMKANGLEVVPLSELVYREGFIVEPHSGLQRKAPRPEDEPTM